VSDTDWSVARHLAGQPPESVALFEAFAELVEGCGPFRYVVSKSSITFAGTRRGFAGARPDRFGLRGYLDLQRQVSDPRFTNSSPYTARLFVHHFRVRQPADLDADFAEWVREAYAVGAGDHLRVPPPP
jgi:Domain of unknown function (DUF5655)